MRHVCSKQNVHTRAHTDARIDIYSQARAHGLEHRQRNFIIKASVTLTYRERVRVRRGAQGLRT
jgi:hypothetical protein